MSRVRNFLLVTPGSSDYTQMLLLTQLWRCGDAAIPSVNHHVLRAMGPQSTNDTPAQGTLTISYSIRHLWERLIQLPIVPLASIGQSTMKTTRKTICSTKAA